MTPFAHKNALIKFFEATNPGRNALDQISLCHMGQMQLRYEKGLPYPHHTFQIADRFQIEELILSLLKYFLSRLLPSDKKYVLNPSFFNIL